MQNNRDRQYGFTLMAAAVSALALFGAAGLAIDIGRVYITKNEAQGVFVLRIFDWTNVRETCSVV